MLQNDHARFDGDFLLHRFLHRPKPIFKVPVAHFPTHTKKKRSGGRNICAHASEQDLLFHLRNPVRRLLLVHDSPCPVVSLLLVPKLPPPDAHDGARIAEAELGVV